MLKKALAAAISLSAAQMVMAQGFYVDEQSALRLGDAFSGGAAQADDASTAFYNPAGLTRLQSRQVTFNLSGVYAVSEFDGTATALGENGTPVAIQGDDAEADSIATIPSIYFSAPMNENMVFGAYINAPYATGTDFGNDSVVRYQGTESSILGVDLGAALGFKVTDSLSLGASMIMQYVGATVAQSVNLSSVCYAAALDPTTSADIAAAGGCAGSIFGIAADEVGTTTNDAQFEMKGDDIAFGFTAGVLYEFTPEIRAGLHYRNQIGHRLGGNAELEIPAAAQSFASLGAQLESTKAKGFASLTTPESLNVSYLHGIGALTVQADVQWTKWSRFDRLVIDTNDSVIASVASPQTYDWEESYRFAVGASYQLNPVLTLRGGIAVDQTPIPDDQTKIDFAFDDYQAISFGMSYVLSDDLIIDAALQKTLAQEREIQQGSLTEQSENLALLNGDVKNDFTSFAAGLRWKF